MCGRLCGCSVWMGVSGEWMCVEGCVGVMATQNCMYVQNSTAIKKG